MARGSGGRAPMSSLTVTGAWILSLADCANLADSLQLSISWSGLEASASCSGSLRPSPPLLDPWIHGSLAGALFNDSLSVPGAITFMADLDELGGAPPGWPKTARAPRDACGEASDVRGDDGCEVGSATATVVLRSWIFFHSIPLTFKAAASGETDGLVVAEKAVAAKATMPLSTVSRASPSSMPKKLSSANSSFRPASSALSCSGMPFSPNSLAKPSLHFAAQ
mmetsp:Transcript_64927/g.193543  ORF Transcript_64927/g.193543 Transcript_64927/m.193543 type:complete len:224 (+) Transcript_64927:639-1310(+)